MTNSIKITHYKKYNHSFKYKYNIYNNKLLIGYIEFIKKDDILILGYLYIYCKYRDKHYGYKIIEYLLSHYKVTCIVVLSEKHYMNQEDSGIGVYINTTVKEKI